MSAPVQELPAAERERAAAAVRGRFDRILWQRLEVRDGELRAVVAGTRHRRPRQLDVGVAAALGLLDQGVPTVGPRAGSRS
ncbi:MAG TPA: hypothetical protein DCS55_01345 [Acidimicrobiaceae bacterium]|nr:hypothetical protein [Acidimicrobiaceae bacterium]